MNKGPFPAFIIPVNRKNENDVNTDLNRYFDGGGAAFRVISHALGDARIVRIATAFFEVSGYRIMRQVLRGKEVRLLLGRPHVGADRVRDVVDEFIRSLSSGAIEERTSTIEELCSSIVQGTLNISLSINTDEDNNRTAVSPRYLYHHAKLYIADRKTAVVSSSNMTEQGLLKSREAGIAVTDPDDVDYFVRRFDRYYKKGIPVAEELLERLREWLALYSPGTIFLRSLIELYGMTYDTGGAGLPELSGYQRPVVSRLIRSFDEHGGAMLVASTGLGKTIMAAHAVAHLRLENRIDQAIIICPAGLRHMWSRAMRAARLSSREYSYYLLSLDDWQRYRDIGILEHELKHVDERTIIILDESHRLRNAIDSGSLRLRHRRIMDAVERGARILLMTATPYSRGVDDINNQLMLIPSRMREENLFSEEQAVLCRVSRAEELADLDHSVVLTSPSVVRYYSSEDENGDRYVLFSGDRRRYFPRKLNIRNVHYNNSIDDALVELITGGYLLKRNIQDPDETPFLIDDGIRGKRDPLFESRVMHQFCSSLKEIDTALSKMQIDGGYEKIRFENQEGLTSFAGGLRCGLQPHFDESSTACDDEKVLSIMNIISEHEGEKTVIFCHYIETSKYIVKCLKKYMPGMTAETTAEKDPDEIEVIIRRFAPVANSIDIDDDENGLDLQENGIRVLVATGAMSEGFNFQDASVLINFDLPWTVLVLAQRMGRILRPWHEPRQVYIYNLIPSTMKNEKMHHAMNWRTRLIERNTEFRSFADIPVIVDKGSEFEMVDLARTMNGCGDEEMDIDQVFKFIQNADELQTSSFIDDMAGLSDGDIEILRGLPEGIKSCRYAPVQEICMYMLFSYRDRIYPVLFDRHGNILMDSEKMDTIMRLLRPAPDEEAAIIPCDPDELDRWVGLSRNTWAISRKTGPEEIAVLCYMILLPEKNS